MLAEDLTPTEGNKMRKLLVLGLLAVVGCATTPISARFAVYNASPDPIQTIVNGDDVGPVILPNGTRSFRVRVEIPNQSGSTEIQDNYAQITVAVRNLDTGTLSQTQQCGVGVKYITTLNYRVTIQPPPYATRDEQFWCNSVR